MKIETHPLAYDSTYFTMSDVAPYYDENRDRLVIQNGKGTRRSWGAPSVTSTVVFRGRSLVAIHVGFSHKHRGGQGWHYWLHEGESWVKVAWGKLSDADRRKVLDRTDRAPSWAKAPGKLRKERRTPTMNTVIAYKMVAVRDGQYVSLYDGNTTYEIGQRLTQAAKSNHGGGYYAFPRIDGLMSLYRKGQLVPSECMAGVSTLAILEVELGGRIIEYPQDHWYYANKGPKKLAATYITPIQVVDTFEVDHE